MEPLDAPANPASAGGTSSTPEAPSVSGASESQKKPRGRKRSKGEQNDEDDSGPQSTRKPRTAPRRKREFDEDGKPILVQRRQRYLSETGRPILTKTGPGRGYWTEAGAKMRSSEGEEMTRAAFERAFDDSERKWRPGGRIGGGKYEITATGVIWEFVVEPEKKSDSAETSSQASTTAATTARQPSIAASTVSTGAPSSVAQAGIVEPDQAAPAARSSSATSSTPASGAAPARPIDQQQSVLNQSIRRPNAPIRVTLPPRPHFSPVPPLRVPSYDTTPDPTNNPPGPAARHTTSRFAIANRPQATMSARSTTTTIGATSTSTAGLGLDSTSTSTTGQEAGAAGPPQRPPQPWVPPPPPPSSPRTLARVADLDARCRALGFLGRDCFRSDHLFLLYCMPLQERLGVRHVLGESPEPEGEEGA